MRINARRAAEIATETAEQKTLWDVQSTNIMNYRAICLAARRFLEDWQSTESQGRRECGNDNGNRVSQKYYLAERTCVKEK
jgi:hypothetical protein